VSIAKKGKARLAKENRNKQRKKTKTKRFKRIMVNKSEWHNTYGGGKKERKKVKSVFFLIFGVFRVNENKKQTK